MWALGGSVVVGLGIVILWYWFFAQRSRSRAAKLLLRIEGAFGGHAKVRGIRWLSASRFELQLQLGNCNFMEPAVTVEMFPRELPLSWIVCKLRKRRETLTFHANLLCPPGFNLEVHNQRWSGKTRKQMFKRHSVMRLKHIGPFVISSRRDWQREITSMMHALSASRDCDLLSVSFRRSAPHFSAMIPLEAIDGQQCAPVIIFDALRELASGASAAKF